MSYAPPRIDGIRTIQSITSFDISGSTPGMGTVASTAYPLGNLALYVPFSVSHPVTVNEGWVIAGSVAGGNFDIGVYDSAGSRLSSSGSTARTASTVNNTTAFTNLDLKPGVRYYMAFSHDGTSNFFALATAAGIWEAFGVLESTTSFVLPASPTLSRTTRAYLPHFGLNLHTVAL